MRKKLRTIKEIKRYIKTHNTIEEILYCLVFFLVPFVFYLAAHFKYLFDYVDDELQVYLEAEKRYSAATRIWLLAIIAILLVILIVKI